MKKILSTLLLLFACAVSVQAQESVQGEAQKQSQPQENPQPKMTRTEYVEKYKSIAIAHMKRYGIPASITMAQGILESSAGNSDLARRSNNHFGIKCKKNWTGAKVYHDDDAKGECFRAYPTVEESYEDHAKFLDDSPRYDSLFAYPSNDYKSWARGLKAAGYATATDYATRLVKIIEDMKLYLLDNEGDETPKNSVAVSDVQVNPNAYRVTVNSHNGYSVYRSNHASYVVAKEGDTYESIGKTFEVSPAILRMFNDAAKDATLSKGDIVYIEYKSTHWLGDEMQHKVGAKENIRSISQLYGIRLKSLLKLNKMNEGDDVKAGDVIRIQ